MTVVLRASATLSRDSRRGARVQADEVVIYEAERDSGTRGGDI
jgi:hypothetical protein